MSPPVGGPRSSSQAPREDYAWLRGVLQSAIDCIIVMDRSGRLVEFNPAAERTFGQIREQVIGRDLADTLLPERLRSSHREALQCYLDHGRSSLLDRRVETVALRADGSEFPAELAIAVTEHQGEPFFTGYLRDISDRRADERQLQMRVVQQAAVAELGQRAMADEDLQSLLDGAVRLVAEALENRFCQILELQPGGDRFLLRAGAGWPAGSVGQVTVGTQHMAGYTLRRGEPVLVEDGREEQRFDVSPALVEQGARSGITVPIRGEDERPWGVLGTHSTCRHRFSDEDVHFLEAVANTLAMAIERRSRSQSLLASEARERARADELNAVMSAVPALVWIAHDFGGTQVTGSQASYEFLGLPEGCNESTAPTGGEPPVRFEAFENGFRLDPVDYPVQRAARGEALIDRELDLRFPDGTWKSLIGSATPLYDDDGQPRGSVAAFLDITQRKRREETAELLAEVTDVLTSSLDYERTLEKVANLAVPRIADWCVVDVREPDGGPPRRFVAHSDPAKVDLAHEFMRRYPSDPDDPKGAAAVLRTGDPQWVAEISDDMLRAAARDEDHLAMLRELGLRSYICMPIKGRGKVLGAISLVMAESGPRPFADDLRLAEELTYRVALAVDNARLYREVQRELADRKRAEGELRRLNERLEERVAERTAELASRADQLRLLAAEVGEAERRERQRLSEILHDNLQQQLVAARMRLSAVRAAPESERDAALAAAGDLVGQAIDEARSLSGELSPPVLHELGLGPALEWLAAWAWERYGLTVTVETDGSPEGENEQLRTLLFQLLRELVLNVVKHAGVSSARVVLERDDDALYLAVIDEGRGFEADRLVRDRSGSAGGLATVVGRLDLLGASIDVDSRPGQGTCVQITVPRERAPVRQPAGSPSSVGIDGERAEGQPESTSPGTGEIVRVLLVDDHAVMRQGLAQLVERESDMEVVGEGASGEEALGLADRLRPDAVVMDISLPGISGIEATRRLSAAQPGLRVIGLSIHDEQGVAAAMLQAGATAYLTKGGSAEDLINSIRRPRGPNGA